MVRRFKNGEDDREVSAQTFLLVLVSMGWLLAIARTINVRTFRQCLKNAIVLA